LVTGKELNLGRFLQPCDQQNKISKFTLGIFSQIKNDFVASNPALRKSQIHRIYDFCAFQIDFKSAFSMIRYYKSDRKYYDFRHMMKKQNRKIMFY